MTPTPPETGPVKDGGEREEAMIQRLAAVTSPFVAGLTPSATFYNRELHEAAGWAVAEIERLKKTKVVLSRLAEEFKALADQAYCDYIRQSRATGCLGWEAKVKAGEFGAHELKAHEAASEHLGRHRAYHAAYEAALKEAKREGGL